MRLSGLPCGGEGGGPKFSDSDFGQQESAGIVEQRRVIALVSRVPCPRNFLSLAHVCKASECCADPGVEATKPKDEDFRDVWPRRTAPSRSRAAWSSPCPMRCSALSWKTATRCLPTSVARCGSTTSASCPRTGWWWRCLPTTCPVAALCTDTSKSRSKKPTRDRTGSRSREGEPERQADLRQVQ